MATTAATPMATTSTANDRPPPQLISFPLNVLTLQDVILDSPVFRSNLEQVAEQSDLFEKWLEGFVRGLKQLLDSLSKTNACTYQMCKQLSPSKKDVAFVSNSQVASMAINGFARALESSLSAKEKLVNDLNESLLKPLQRLLKTDMKEFKDMRRAFEKTFDKYEHHLCRYSNLSKQKEPSALREDAFQMFDIQKSYVRASGTYFMQLITLKSKVEHLLVDCFATGLTNHLDHLDLSLSSQNSVRTLIPGWRVWLDESIATCDYQLEQIQQSTQTLEDIYIRQIRPHRSLKRYSTCSNDQLAAITNSSTFNSLSDNDTPTGCSPGTHSKMGSSTSLPSSTSFQDMQTSLVVKPSLSSTSSTSKYSSSSSSSSSCSSSSSGSQLQVKQGYLFFRVAIGKPSRYSWVRRWFFLKDGWFGQYSVSTVNKVKGSLVIGDRIPINSSMQCRIFTDIDRRFCFKVAGSDRSFIVQSETEQDMYQWLWAIEGAKELLYGKELSLSVDDMAIPRALLSPKATMPSRKPMNDLTVLPPLIPTLQGLPSSKHSAAATDYLMNDLSATSALTALMILESINTNHMHSSRMDDKDATCTTLTQPSSNGDDNALVDTSQRYQRPDSSARRQTNASTISSWSVPWLISGITALSSTSIEVDSTSIDGWIQKQGNSQQPDAYVIWPNKVELETPRVLLNSYSDDLAAGQRELRRYFTRVPNDEIVLDVFSASFYRHASPSPDKDSSSDCSDDDSDRHSHLQDTGNGYSGTVYMTQRRLWFYSCRMMTCVNALAIPFKSIKTVRLEKTHPGKLQGTLMYISTKEAPYRTYCFGLWLEVAELIVERLRIATKNATRSEKLDDQALFDLIRCTTLGKIRPRSPTSQVIATTTSNAAVTPLTVQAQARLTTEPQAIFKHNNSVDIHSSFSPPSTTSSLSDSSSPSTAKVSIERHHYCTSPAAGALTAAMEAANEARIAKSNAHLSKKSTSSSATIDDTTLTNTSTEDDLKKMMKKDSKPTTPQGNADIGDSTLPTPTPAEPAVCGCDDHLDKRQADLELPISAQALYDFMFGMSCWEQLTKAKGNSVPSASKWQHGKDGKMERVLNYLMPNPSPMVKAKDAEVFDTHQVLKQEDGLRYVIMITTKVPILPYADAFIPMMKFCITYNTPTTCRLVCSIGMKWLKSVMMKGMINRAAFKGMGETISALTVIAQQTATLDKQVSSFGGSTRQQKQHNVAQNDIIEQRSTNKIPLTLDEQDLQGDTKPVEESNILTSATILSPRRLVTFVGVALLLLFSTTLFMTRSPPPFASTLLHSPATTSSISSWRAVHLVDLESFVYGETVGKNWCNSSAYQTFKTSRSDSGHWNYHWVNIRHRLIAAELTFTREKLAVIRYELLTAFDMLNGMDQRLLESEYWTWLLDQRSQCDTVAMEMQSDSSHKHLVLCNEVNRALSDI